MGFGFRTFESVAAAAYSVLADSWYSVFGVVIAGYILRSQLKDEKEIFAELIHEPLLATAQQTDKLIDIVRKCSSVDKPEELIPVFLQESARDEVISNKPLQNKPRT